MAKVRKPHGPFERVRIPYEPHPGQVVFHRSMAKTRVLACGRRWGKDMGCVMELLRLCLQLRDRNAAKPLLVPTVHAWIIGPSYPMVTQLWRELLERIPRVLWAKPPNQTTRTLELSGGIVIEVRSAESFGGPGKDVGLVGVGLDVLVVTEASKIREEVWSRALLPTLTSPGRAGLALVNGTPRGYDHWFHRLYAAGQNPERKGEVESWNWPTAMVGADGRMVRHAMGNPHVDLAELERVRMEMPERYFRQEILAEFLSDGGAVFRTVERCLGGVLDAPRAGDAYHAGIDLAKFSDWTVVVVMDEANRVVAFERWRRVDWEIQKRRIKEILERYNSAAARVDATGVGDPVVEALQREGLQVEGVVLTGPAKRELIDALIVAMESVPPGVTIPQKGCEVLVGELKAYEYKLSSAGNVRTNAPEGEHDDCVVALALANRPVAAAGETGEPLVEFSRYEFGFDGAGRFVEGEGDSDPRDQYTENGTRISWNDLKGFYR